MTAVAELPMSAPPAPLARPAPAQWVVLNGISWPEYEGIGAILRERANLRLTYDRGRLEIMTLSPEHERIKIWLGLLVYVLAEETGMPLSRSAELF
jgi:Uma2 family endonuclease